MQVGRRFKLDVEDRFVMVLVSYRLYITYTLTGFQFDLDQGDYTDIQKIEGLQSCLPLPQKLYNLAKRLKSKEEVEEYFPDFLAFVDCTEQPVPRPKKRLGRRLYYSGKRKKHPVKNLYTVNEPSRLIRKTQTQTKRKKV